MKTLESHVRTIVGVVLFGSLAACADMPSPAEERGSSTARLMRAEPKTELPASRAVDFADAVGGPIIELTGWEGYVAGTDKSGLFVMHFSGVNGSRPVAGLSFAFVEDEDGEAKGDLEARLRGASALEVRFNDGSGLVSRRVFDPRSDDTTTSAHADAPSSKALLERAYNDAEALLQAAPSNIGGNEDAKACLANFLTTVSDAARCVNDANNTLECSRVRDDAFHVATTCQGTETANVLASAGKLAPRALGNESGLFNDFKGLGTGGIGAILGKLGGGKGGASGILGKVLGGLGGGGAGGKGELLKKLLAFLPKLFAKKNFAGLAASPNNGAVTLLGGAED